VLSDSRQREEIDMEMQAPLITKISGMFHGIADLLLADPSGDFRERQLAVQLLADYFARIYEEKAQGNKLAWVNYAVPSELFWALDITPVEIDAVCGITAQNSEDAIPYIDRAHEVIPDYICSVNKIFLGAALSGDIPMPDMIVVPSHPCDSNLATYPVLAERFGFPYFCIDAPYFRDERGLRHVTAQMWELAAFLEAATGRKLTYQKLREVMEHSNRAHEYVLKIAQLAQSVPSPFSSMDMLTDYALILGLAGTPELPHYLEQKYHIVKERMKKHQGRQSKERLRCIWIYGAPVFDFSFFSLLENKYGAFAVGNMNNNFIMKPVDDLSSIDSMLRGLAAKTINLPMGRECGGPWENYIDAMIDLCKRFKADAAIFAGHVACKANWPIMKLVKDRISDELGIPTLIFGLDLMDPRITPPEAVKAQFDDFFSVHFPEVVPEGQ
jgi:benzoyl-CoA reductase/2-hydroxyglutaryl-CoA dehydratase subunit BcrC/BadD/HgdB